MDEGKKKEGKNKEKRLGGGFSWVQLQVDLRVSL
jgi:hypothetical protein